MEGTWYPDNRSMYPVARTKGIVHKDVGHMREFACKTRIILLFTRIESQVLKKDNFPLLHFGHDLLNPGSNRFPQRFNRSL